MWLFVSTCVYEIPRLLSLLVLACMLVFNVVRYSLPGVLVFGCVARCIG